MPTEAGSEKGPGRSGKDSTSVGTKALVLSLLMLPILLWLRWHDWFGGSPESVAAAPSPPVVAQLDVEALEMARAFRTFYPSARIVDEASDPAIACVAQAKGNKTAIAKCVAALDDLITKTLAELPAKDGLTGCSLTMGKAVREALLAAKEEAGKEPAQRTGVPFRDIHAATAECSARLFRVGMNAAMSSPAVAPDVAAQLGLRDDGIPGPASYAKRRDGGLWTATGREINRETLELR